MVMEGFNVIDLVLVSNAFGSKPSTPECIPLTDVNGDGRIDISDLTIVASQFGG